MITILFPSSSHPPLQLTALAIAGVAGLSVGSGQRDHLESVEVGYSDIFLEYSINLTTRSICLEYSDIYLEYVNPFSIPGICLEYA
jgi:hypothetical protein